MRSDKEEVMKKYKRERKYKKAELQMVFLHIHRLIFHDSEQ